MQVNNRVGPNDSDLAADVAGDMKENPAAAVAVATNPIAAGAYFAHKVDERYGEEIAEAAEQVEETVEEVGEAAGEAWDQFWGQTDYYDLHEGADIEAPSGDWVGAFVGEASIERNGITRTAEEVSAQDHAHPTMTPADWDEWYAEAVAEDVVDPPDPPPDPAVVNEEPAGDWGIFEPLRPGKDYDNPINEWIGENGVRWLIGDERLAEPGGLWDTTLLTARFVTEFTSLIDPTPVSDLVNAAGMFIDGDREGAGVAFVGAAVPGGFDKLRHLERLGNVAENIPLGKLGNTVVGLTDDAVEAAAKKADDVPMGGIGPVDKGKVGEELQQVKAKQDGD